ncbi:hypothetical protein OF83DRAFT_1100819 [Amylostereum chailletii]|nr:hypothetical protein OF83DRAFT_1100819 [Amylostereum chailletii]
MRYSWLRASTITAWISVWCPIDVPSLSPSPTLSTGAPTSPIFQSLLTLVLPQIPPPHQRPILESSYALRTRQCFGLRRRRRRSSYALVARQPTTRPQSTSDNIDNALFVANTVLGRGWTSRRRYARTSRAGERERERAFPISRRPFVTWALSGLRSLIVVGLSEGARGHVPSTYLVTCCFPGIPAVPFRDPAV